MDENKILSEVKYRAGIFFDDEQVDSSIKSMIAECKEYLFGAGVKEEQLQSPITVVLYTMWVTSSRNNALDNLPQSPAFISFICQLRHYVPPAKEG